MVSTSSCLHRQIFAAPPHTQFFVAGADPHDADPLGDEESVLRASARAARLTRP